jgi:hypothetical protein
LPRFLRKSRYLSGNHHTPPILTVQTVAYRDRMKIPLSNRNGCFGSASASTFIPVLQTTSHSLRTDCIEKNFERQSILDADFFL